MLKLGHCGCNRPCPSSMLPMNQDAERLFFFKLHPTASHGLPILQPILHRLLWEHYLSGGRAEHSPQFIHHCRCLLGRAPPSFVYTLYFKLAIEFHDVCTQQYSLATLQMQWHHGAHLLCPSPQHLQVHRQVLLVRHHQYHHAPRVVHRTGRQTCQDCVCE
ncbi:hypothetical protein M405DRAFT_905359 [Rhizopogon salebrosus TDB-379]|nr:hypothetical protein M405DRAFT_905359 [Rhizopogon salebrosus TDB-379]